MSIGCRTTSVVEQSPIIFETNFANDSGYEHLASTNPETELGNIPSLFDAVKVTQGSRLATVPSEGVGGSNAMGLFYSDDTQPSIKMFKHLSADQSKGYDRIFLRVNVKLPETFRSGGNNQVKPFWKWFRFWQNTAVTNDASWGENRPDSGYIVSNFGGDGPYTRASFIFSENFDTDGTIPTSGRILPQHSVKLAPWGQTPETTLSYFENVGNGSWSQDTDNPDLNLRGFLTNPIGQVYHTIEYEVLLATTPTSDDGEINMFIDGVSAGNVRIIDPLFGAPQRTGLPTSRTPNGSGINFLNLFDNMQGFNQQWTGGLVTPYIYLNDVVVSTQRIGHSYVAGNSDNPGIGAT